MNWRNIAASALILAAFSLLASVWLFTGLRDEGEQRRDQTCVILEGQQKLEVDRLARTYDYLADLSPREMRDPIARAVLAQLPQVEAEARADNAPPYCDVRGVGLPEPDPVIPQRPVTLR